MDFKIILSLPSLCFLLLGCAQVGSISGGEKDSTAPQVVEMTPPNETINFTGNSISLEFDEFVQLKQAATTISIVPKDTRIQAEVKGKTVRLFWEDSLRENTTYSIFLNKTIKDITESNDTLMQLVFSTGKHIDSLTYTCFVKGAKSSQPKKGVTVGLFEHRDSLVPLYFSESNSRGKAQFNYLKKGSYYIRAFQDDNSDGAITLHEAIAFSDDVLQLDSATVDSIPLSFFQPEKKAKITHLKYFSPRGLVLATNRNLENAEIHVNNTLVDSANIHFLSADSLLLFHVVDTSKQYSVVVESPSFSDSSSLRLLDTKRKEDVLVYSSQKQLLPPKSSILLEFSDKIVSVDTTKIELMNAKDTSAVPFSFYITKNQLAMSPLIDSLEKFQLHLSKGAIHNASDNTNKRYSSAGQIGKEEDFGTLRVQFPSYSSEIIVQLVAFGKVIREVVHPKQVHVFNHLVPREYSFRIIQDTNGNGKWDTGSFEEGKQPESIEHYSQTTKLRANWEVEVVLERHLD